MIIRVPETHVCPDATKEAKATPLTADIRSASLNTIIGAYRINVRRLRSQEFHLIMTLPPSSAVNAAKLDPTILPSARPVDVPACIILDG
jgi:hypothetical protein